MFDIYSSDTEEPRLNMSAFYGRKRFYSKNNKARMTDMEKQTFLNLSEQMSDWNHLKISIETAIEKLNPGNIRCTSIKLFRLNIIRGKGLLCQSIMKAVIIAPHLTHMYAMLISFINLEFPNVVELLLMRCVYELTNAYRRDDEEGCMPPVILIAHLVNRNVIKDWLVLDILNELLHTPKMSTLFIVDDILKVCGKKLNFIPQNKIEVKYMFDTLNRISKDEKINKSVQCFAKIIFITYRDRYIDEHEFDLEELRKQYSHSLTLNCEYNPQYELDTFTYDLDYRSNEIMYNTYIRKILKSKLKGNAFGKYGDSDEMADDEDECETETDMLSLSNNIAIKKVISIMVSLKLPAFDVALELMRIKLKPGREKKLCNIYLECCFDNGAVYNKYFGDIIQNFCLLNPKVRQSLEIIFMQRYPNIHNFHPNTFMNLAKLFAQLLYTDSISWNIFSTVHLTLSESTCSGREYLKAMFKELILLMGRDGLKQRILCPYLRRSFAGLFPLNNYGNSLLCVTFFSEIGLHDLIVQFRESLQLGVPV